MNKMKPTNEQLLKCAHHFIDLNYANPELSKLPPISFGRDRLFLNKTLSNVIILSYDMNTEDLHNTIKRKYNDLCKQWDKDVIDAYDKFVSEGKKIKSIHVLRTLSLYDYNDYNNTAIFESIVYFEEE